MTWTKCENEENNDKRMARGGVTQNLYAEQFCIQPLGKLKTCTFIILLGIHH